MDINEVKKRLENLKPLLRESYKVKSIGIFGSYFRGEEKSGSDIDILVEFEDSAGPSLLGFVRLENLLSEALGVKVDLVEKKYIKA
jgi:predicted nucleotidyltransferase